MRVINHSGDSGAGLNGVADHNTKLPQNVCVTSSLVYTQMHCGCTWKRPEHNRIVQFRLDQRCQKRRRSFRTFLKSTSPWFEWVDSDSNLADGLSRDGAADPWTLDQDWELHEFQGLPFAVSLVSLREQFFPEFADH